MKTSTDLGAGCVVYTGASRASYNRNSSTLRGWSDRSGVKSPARVPHYSGSWDGQGLIGSGIQRNVVSRMTVGVSRSREVIGVNVRAESNTGCNAALDRKTSRPSTRLSRLFRYRDAYATRGHRRVLIVNRPPSFARLSKLATPKASHWVRIKQSNAHASAGKCEASHTHACWSWCRGSTTPFDKVPDDDTSYDPILVLAATSFELKRCIMANKLNSGLRR